MREEFELFLVLVGEGGAKLQGMKQILCLR